MPPPSPDQPQFLASLNPSESFEQLFEHLPGISFFAKDRQSVIMRANQSFLARFGFRHEAEIIGKTDYDLFPEAMAEHFRSDDRAVMESGTPKINLVELFPNRQGIPDWFITNKLPLRGRDGEIVGVTGTVQHYRPAGDKASRFGQISKAVDHIGSHFHERIEIGELASMVGLSTRQFNRLFKQAFNITPKSFITKSRVKAACDALRASNEPIDNIAPDLGFYDQSAFTSQFRREMGITPNRYRKQYRPGG